MNSLSSKWRIVNLAFLVLFGIGGVIMKDYLVTALLLSSNAAFLMNPKQSRTQSVSQIGLLILAFIVGCAY